MPEPLKLIAPTLPDPERPVLHETTYDLGKDGSKWSHGFIPLNAAAVALKHHKQPGGDGGGSTAKGLASRDSGSATNRADVEDMRSARAASDSELADRAKHADPHRKAAAKTEIARRAKPTAAKSTEPMKRLSIDHPNVLGADWKRLTSDDPKVRKAARADAAAAKSADEHVKLAIGHNEAAKRALDRGDKAAAERHVAKSREHNAAAIEAGNAVLGKNAIDRQTLEGHAAALAVPIKDRTADQQKAAADALAYAKELRAKRLAKKSPPKVKQQAAVLKGRKTPAVRGSQSVAGVRFNDSQAQRGQR